MNVYVEVLTIMLTQMFGLLSDITISDYKEVFDSILTPLYHLNMKFKDKQFSKQTIRSLAKCFLNNVSRMLYIVVFYMNATFHYLSFIESNRPMFF